MLPSRVFILIIRASRVSGRVSGLCPSVFKRGRRGSGESVNISRCDAPRRLPHLSASSETPKNLWHPEYTSKPSAMRLFPHTGVRLRKERPAGQKKKKRSKMAVMFFFWLRDVRSSARHEWFLILRLNMQAIMRLVARSRVMGRKEGKLGSFFFFSFQECKILIFVLPKRYNSVLLCSPACWWKRRRRGLDLKR